MGARRWSLLLFAILALLTVPPAHAGNATVLPFLGFGDMAVDSTTEHVFISSGVGGSSVAVLDFDGNLVKTITGQQGATGLAVDETSGTLYVALSNVSQISMIDTTTLNERSRVAPTGMSSPRSLVLAGGRLWIGYGCATGGAGSVALDGSDPHTYYTWSGCARFARYPGDPNRFAVIE